MDPTVDDLDRVRQQVGSERWILLGHSFGGLVALEYERRHHEHVAVWVAKRQHRLGAADCTQDGCLRQTLGQSFAIETEFGYAQKRQQEPDDRGQRPCLALHLVEPIEQLLAILLERFDADDRSQAAALP
jgi:pimeloyl-ACP methyl ester carboxylesterase